MTATNGPVNIFQLHAMIIARDVLLEQMLSLVGGAEYGKIWGTATTEIDEAIMGGLLTRHASDVIHQVSNDSPAP